MDRGYRPSLLAWLIGKGVYVCADGSCFHVPAEISDDLTRPAPRSPQRPRGPWEQRAQLRD